MPEPRAGRFNVETATIGVIDATGRSYVLAFCVYDEMPVKGKCSEPFNRIHQLPQRLRWKALTSKTMLRYFANRILGSTNRKVRSFLFNMLAETPGADFAYVNRGRERYLVNCHDKAISKMVFATGEFEFEKFE